MSFRIKISLPCAFLMFFIINISTSSSFCFSQNKVNKSIKKEVNGEVFIVTKGAGNIKLGLVTVYFLTEKQYKIASNVNSPNYLNGINLYNTKDSIIEANKINKKGYDQFKKFAQSYRDLEVRYSANHSKQIAQMDSMANYYLRAAINHHRFTTDKRAESYSIQCFVDSARQNIISDKTNSDGKFSVKLNNQKYWVCANSTRKVSDDSEEYYWAFEYIPDGKPLFLSNDNLK